MKLQKSPKNMNANYDPFCPSVVHYAANRSQGILLLLFLLNNASMLLGFLPGRLSLIKRVVKYLIIFIHDI